MARLGNATGSNLLNRHALDNNTINREQIGLDAALGNFVHHASDSTNLFAMTMGSMAFRFLRVGALEGAAAAGVTRLAPQFANSMAWTTALMGEVAAFRSTHSLLNGQSLSEAFAGRDFAASTIDFALLKGAGRLGGNPVLSNLGQSSAMVLGRDVSAQLHLVEQDHRGYIERLAEAQASTLALNAGASLFGTMSGGRIHRIEQALDARLQATQITSQLQRSALGARSEGILGMGAQGESPSNLPAITAAGEKAALTAKGWIIGGITRTLLYLATRPNFRPHLDPDKPFAPPPHQDLNPTPANTHEMFARRWAEGQAREDIQHMRWAYDNVHESLRPKFLRFLSRYRAYQERVRERTDSLLAQMPRLNLEALNETAGQLGQAYSNLVPENLRRLPEGSLELGRAYTLRENLARLNLRSTEDYARLTDADMIRLGLHPRSLQLLLASPHAEQNNGSLDIEHILSHPLLRDLPETHELARVAREYVEIVASLRSRSEALEQAEKKNKKEERKADQARLAEIQAEREARKEEIRHNEQAYRDAIEKLRTPMRALLFEQGNVNEISWRGRVVQIEHARLGSYREALQLLNHGKLTEAIQAVEFVKQDVAEAARKIKGISRELNNYEALPLAARIMAGAMRVINWDHFHWNWVGFRYTRLTPMILRGEYEKLVFDLQAHLGPQEMDAILGFHAGSLKAQALERSVELTASYGERFFRETEAHRLALAKLQAENNLRWQEELREVVPLLLEEVDLQKGQVDAHLGNLKLRERALKAKQKVEGKIDELKRMVEQRFPSTPMDAADHAHGNGKNDFELKFDRCLFDTIEAVAIYRAEARAQLRRSFRDFRIPVVSVTAQAVADKAEASHRSLAEKFLTPNGLWNSIETFGALVLQRGLFTVGHVIGFFARANREETLASIHWTLQNWVRWMVRLTGSHYRVNPHGANLVAMNRFIESFQHISWWDFLPFLKGARAANLKKPTQRANPRISAKADLREKMIKSGLSIIARIVELITENVKPGEVNYHGSITAMARHMAFGEIPAPHGEQREVSPDTTHDGAIFPQLFMPVEAMIPAFGFDLYPAASRLSEPMQGGRDWEIANRFTALTSRAAWMMVGASLGVVNQYAPKPDTVSQMRMGPSTVVTDIVPVDAITDVTRSDAEAKTSRVNWWRTILYHHTLAHDTNTPASLRWFRFARYGRPIDNVAEQAFADLFGGALGAYPNPEGSKALSNRLAQLAEARAPEAAVIEATRASHRYDISLVETQLNRALLEIRAARKSGQKTDEGRELVRIIESRKALLAKLTRDLESGRGLNEAQQREWTALRESALHPEQGHKSRQVLDLALALRSQVRDHRSKEIRKILDARIQQLRIAVARNSLGERLSPAEELLINEMELAFTNPSDAQADRIVTAIREPLSVEAHDRLIRQEKIREETRRLVRLMPGGGRGSIDGVDEAIHDQARVVQNAAGEVVAGPNERAQIIPFAGLFAGHCLHMGFGEAMVDGAVRLASNTLVAGVSLVSKEHGKTLQSFLHKHRPNLYTKHSGAVGRGIMSPVLWRPEIDVQSIRNVEELRIRAREEGRPIIVASQHASWVDITSIMALVPEGRFTYKKELLFTMILIPPLVGGRHAPLVRGNPAQTRIAMQEASERMIEDETATAHFLGGTRSKTGKQASAKKGAAHMALDTNALVLVLAANGTFEIMSTSWGELLSKGPGMHRRVAYRSTLITDPRALHESAQSPYVLAKTAEYMLEKISELRGTIIAPPRELRGWRKIRAQADDIWRSVRRKPARLTDAQRAQKDLDDLVAELRVVHPYGSLESADTFLDREYLPTLRELAREIPTSETARSRVQALLPPLARPTLLTVYAHEQLMNNIEQALDTLYQDAQSGNIMARAELNQQMSRLERGMELVRNGELENARIWAEGSGKKDQGMKTDLDLLVRLTHWWDARRTGQTSSPQ